MLTYQKTLLSDQIVISENSYIGEDLIGTTIAYLSPTFLDFLTVIKNIADPELNISIFQMGLFYEIIEHRVDDKPFLSIQMTFTTASCSFIDHIYQRIIEVCSYYYDERHSVEVVFIPKWGKHRVDESTRFILFGEA